MNAKQAVDAARIYFVELVGVDPSVEEVWFEAESKTWCITLGRSRMLREESAGLVVSGAKREIIEYKIVRVDDQTVKPVSLLNREHGRAA